MGRRPGETVKTHGSWKDTYAFLCFKAAPPAAPHVPLKVKTRPDKKLMIIANDLHA